MLKKVLALVLTLSFCLSLLFVNGSFAASAAIIGGFDFGITSSDSEDSEDFDYENDLSQIMRRFDPSFETVFLPAKPEMAAISSTYVRELLRYGCSLEDAVPECIVPRMTELFRLK